MLTTLVEELVFCTCGCVPTVDGRLFRPHPVRQQHLFTDVGASMKMKNRSFIYIYGRSRALKCGSAVIKSGLK